MTGGLIAVAVAVAVTIMLDFALRRRSGRFRAGQFRGQPCTGPYSSQAEASRPPNAGRRERRSGTTHLTTQS